MEQNAPYPPECQGDGALASSQGEGGSDTEPSTTTKPSFRYRTRTGVITKAMLWRSFFDTVVKAKVCLRHYLEHMQNIRKVDSSTSVPPTTLQSTDNSQLLSDKQQMMENLLSSTLSPGVDIERERNMMKACADLALSHVREMDEILDLFEMSFHSSESLLSETAVLWTHVFFALAVTIPFEPVAQFAAGGALFCAAELLRPSLYYWFNKYNLSYLRQETRDLIRALQEGKVSEKKVYLESWHLEFRSWLWALCD